jgi:heme/copper-type cytochrome/quinol oxidase subunit 2
VTHVFLILFTMLAILALATVVVVYVAFPYRGRKVPKAGWVGDTMQRGVDRLPTLDNPRR